MRWSAGGKVWMVVEPVRYDSHDTENPRRTSFRCGVFFLSAEGAASFVPTIGYGNYEPAECTALKEVRFKYPKGRTAPPRIEISYAGNTPNTASEQDVVLSWGAAKKAYVEDDR